MMTLNNNEKDFQEKTSKRIQKCRQSCMNVSIRHID